jgi:20S proteasome subunit alpha 7
LSLHCRLQGVHDDTKDKPFELELGWVSAATGWRFQAVPKARVAIAEAWARQQLEDEAMGDDDD